MSTNINYTYNKIHDFSPSGGTLPFDGLFFGNDGFLYGTTSSGGTYNYGTIFKIDPTTYNHTVLHHFTGGTQGYDPVGGLIQGNDGVLYGTTWNGSNLPNRGVIFSCSTSGNYGVLYNLGTNNNAAGALLEVSNGVLYGTSYVGGIYGVSQTHGSIFSCSTLGTDLTMLYSFSGSVNNQNPLALPKDGRQPNGNLIKATNGVLYGTTVFDGLDLPNNGGGIIFSYTTSGVYQVLKRFSGGTTDGRYPVGGLIQASNGTLYGTTSEGGTLNKGTIFSYDLLGNYQLLYNFSGTTDGQNPFGSLVQGDDGLLYGMTVFGGSYSAGTIFSFNISTNNLTLIHDFEGAISNDGNPTNYFYNTISVQNRIIQAPDGKLYGLTYGGGQYSAGTIFQFYDGSCVVTGTTVSGCTGLTIVTATTVNPSCGNSGSITITISGGNPNYKYDIVSGALQYTASTSATTYTFTGVSQGSWVISVTDTSGNPIGYSSNPLTLTNTFYGNFTHLSGNTVCLYVSGGTPPYNIYVDQIYTTSASTDGTYCFTTLCNMNHQYEVYDSAINDPCYYTELFNFTCSTPNVTVSVSGACGYSSAEVDVSGGTPGYVYYAVNGNDIRTISAGTTTLTFNNLPSGTWDFYVIDSFGTQSQVQPVTITNLCNADVYWQNNNSLCFYITGGTAPYDIYIDSILRLSAATSATTYCFSADCTVSHTFAVIDHTPDCVVTGLGLSTPVFGNPDFTGTTNVYWSEASAPTVFGLTYTSYTVTFTGGFYTLQTYIDTAPSSGGIFNQRYLNNYYTWSFPQYPKSVRYRYEFSAGTIDPPPSPNYNQLFFRSPFAIGTLIGSNISSNQGSVGYIPTSTTPPFIQSTLNPSVYSGYSFTIFNSYYSGTPVEFQLDYLQVYVDSYTYDCRCTLSGTTPVCPPPSIDVSSSFSASTCTNDGAILINILSGGTPNYNYILKSGTTIISTFGPTSLTAHTFTGLNQGSYDFYVTDSSSPQLSSTTTTTIINNTFYVNLYNTSATSTGSTFCYIVTGASTNIVEGFYYAEYSGSTIIDPLYFTGNSNTTNCFTVPITDCGDHTFYLQEYGQNITTTVIPPLYNCSGGTDVLFLVDYTNTMGPVIDDIKTSIGQIVNTIVSVSNNDYQLALAVFDEQCRSKSPVPPYNGTYYTSLPANQKIVVNIPTTSTAPCGTTGRTQYFTAIQQFTNNAATFQNSVSILNTPTFVLGNGVGGAEPSDQAVYYSTLNQLPAQVNNFVGNFRQNSAKFIILITDNQPSGTNDQWDFSDPIYITNTLIPQCNAAGIRVILMRNCSFCAGDGLDNLAIQTSGYTINNYDPIAIQSAMTLNCQGQVITNVSQISGCSYTTIYNTPCLTPSASTTSINPYCQDSCFGEIEISISGGQAPYLFQLTDSNGVVLSNKYNVPTSAYTFTNPYVFEFLCAGTYYPTVLDNLGFITTGSPITLTYTFDANISISPTLTGQNGTICVDISGSSLTGYTIFITNSSTNVQDTYLGVLGSNCYVYSAGCYSVDVYDNFVISNCNVTGTTCIPATAFTCSTVSFTQPTCAYANGTITPSVLGGVGPFKYDLYKDSLLFTTKNSPLRNPGAFTGLSSGTYDFIITDTSNNLQINCFSGIVLYNSFYVDIDLLSTCSPTIDYRVTVSGGTAPYSVYFSPAYQYTIQAGTSGFTVPCTITSVTVSDSSVSACTYTESFSAICGPDLTFTVTNGNCNATQLGSITINGSGGNPPYEYSIDAGITFGSNNVFTNLFIGTYNLAIRDISGCTKNATTVVGFIDAPLITATTTAVSCLDYNSGTINIGVSGGIPDYQYSISGLTGPFVSGDTFTGITFTGLSSGTYDLYVRDSSGCFTQETVLIDGAINLSITATPITCTNSNGGTITVVPTTGTAPFQYSIDYGSFGVSNIFTGLTGGIHYITVQDNTSCTATTFAIVNYPFDIQVFSSSPNCVSTSNGYIVASATGSTIPYEYSLDGGSFTFDNIFTGLTAGTYTVLAKDKDGCTAQTTVTLVAESLTIGIATTPNNICLYQFPDANGTIDISILNPGGGVGPYSYLIQATNYPITSANTTGYFTDLFDDLYTVQVTDTVLSCTTTTTVDLPATRFPSATGVVTNVNCLGPNTGSILMQINSGVPNFTYILNLFNPGIGTTQVDNGITSANTVFFSGLSSGFYFVDIVDSNGCYGRSEFPTLLGPISVNTNITPPTCFTYNNASVTLSATTGTPPFQYSIDGTTFSTSGTFTGLTAGTYTFIVRDSLNCTASTITVVPGALDISATTTDETCLLTSAGTINATVISGGTAPYTYSIDGVTFSSSGYFTGLTFGTYTIVAQDSVTCSASTQITLYQPQPIILSVNTLPELCNQLGTIQIGVLGGVSPYQYGISGGTLSASPIITVSGGTYDVIVIDSYGCSATTQAIVDGVIPMGINATVTNESCLYNSGGTITIIATGGTLPYQYSIDNGSTFSNNNYFTGLTIGSFNLLVNDVNGCSATTTVSVGAPIPVTVSAVTSTVPNCGSISTTSITLLGSGGTPPYSYVWSGSSSTNQTLVVDYLTSAGTYTINATVLDIFGCSGTTSVTFTATSTETPPIIIGDDVITCICNSTTLSIIDTGGYTYTGLTWSNGSTASTISVSSCTQGILTYYVTGLNEFGCTVTSNTVTVIFSDLIINPFKIDATCPTCNDGRAEVQIINGIGPYTYNWTGVTSNSYAVTDLAPGTYSVLVTDSAGCVELVTFEIFGKRPVDCIYEPIRNLFGDIVLNPDGSISFYDTTVGPNRIVDCVPEECCLEYSTLQLPLEYCDCKCIWRQGCTTTGDTTVDKLILGANGTNGVQLGPSSSNDIKTCQYQVSFDYMFNFDCTSLFQCIDTIYSGSVLNFLNGLSASATIESLVSGNTYVTKQIVPIWSFNLLNDPTGVYFAGQDPYCDLIYRLLFNQLGFGCSALTDTSFAAIWRTASFKVDESLSGATIKIGILLNGFNCDYNLLVDNIRIEEVCIITNDQIISSGSGAVGSAGGSTSVNNTNGGCPGFDLVKIIDNKKSWVYNETTYNRDWYHLKYRDTSYVDYDERLDINTKEVDININPANAINFSLYCYTQAVSGCCVSTELYIPSAKYDNIFDPIPPNGPLLLYATNPIIPGHVYTVSFGIVADSSGQLPQSVQNLTIGFISTANTTEYLLFDNITVTAPAGGGVNNYTFNFTVTANTTPSLTAPLSVYDGFYIRITTPWVGIEKFSVVPNSISIKEYCEPTPSNLSNVLPISTATTYNQFVGLVQTELIDVKDRQTLSAYPLLRYYFDLYLGLCGGNIGPNSGNPSGPSGSGATSGTTSGNCSQQYNYGNVNSFANAISNYWLDLIEQLVPATTIWGGGSSGSVGMPGSPSSNGVIGGGGSRGNTTYSNTIFDQNKFVYRDFQIGYCDTEYCFEGPDGEPTYSAACYIAQSGNITLTPAGFSALTSNLATTVNSTLIGSKILTCSQAKQITCGTVNPIDSFASMTYGIKFEESGVIVSATTTQFTDINNLPSASTYLNLIYGGLGTLGYSIQYPYNGLEISKVSNSGCTDPINMTPYLTVRYSCLTASTVVISGNPTTIVYDSMFNNFPSNSVRVDGKIALSGDSIIYGVVRESTTPGTYGYIYYWNIVSPNFNVVRTFLSTNSTLLKPCSGVVLAPDGYLYGTTLINGLLPNNGLGGLYRIDPTNPSSYQELHKFIYNDGGGAWNGQELLVHSDGNIYIPLVMSTPVANSAIYKWDVSTQTGSYLFSLPFYTSQIYLTSNKITGEIYGTTSNGGSNGGGSIFAFDPTSLLPNYGFYVINNFNQTSGISNPSGPLLEVGPNVFYGLTNGINATNQSLYRLNSLLGSVTPIHIFNTAIDDTRPKGQLEVMNGRIYGITTTSGKIFEYTISTNTFKYVHNFNGGTNGIVTSAIYFPTLVYGNTQGYDWIYGTTIGGGNNNLGTIYRIGYNNTGSTNTVSGAVFYECTFVGTDSGTNIQPFNKQQVNFSAGTYVQSTSITGLPCTPYCPGLVVNPDVEVIVEDLSDALFGPCIVPGLTKTCNLVYATHVDSDVWFEGTVTVTQKITPNSTGGAVLITTGPAL